MATTAITHRTGTREEWLAERLELLKDEKALSRQGDELTRRRMDLPWVKVDKEYRFDTGEGEKSLKDLFGGRSQLLVYHLDVRARLHRALRLLLDDRRWLQRLLGASCPS